MVFCMHSLCSWSSIMPPGLWQHSYSDIQVIQNGSVLRTAVIFFYLSNEGISIIENVALIGLPVPKKLKEVLEQLHEEADEKKEDE